MLQLAMVAIMATLYYHRVARNLDAAIVMLASCTALLSTVTQDYIPGVQGVIVALIISAVIVMLGHLPKKRVSIHV